MAMHESLPVGREIFIPIDYPGIMFLLYTGPKQAKIVFLQVIIVH
jgi:hypothetical protein